MPDFPPIQKELNACTVCNACVPICPPYQEIQKDEASPMAKVVALRNHERRTLRDILFGRSPRIDRDFTRGIYECTSCGACEEVCPVDIPFSRLWDQVKAWLVGKGLAPLPQHRQICDSVTREHNVLGEPHGKRADWVTADVRQADVPEVVFWVGCMESYRQQQVAAAVIRIFNAAQVKYRVLGTSEWCTGSPLMRVGHENVVKMQLMPHNIAAVTATGAKALVTACAECYRTFLRDYRELGGVPPFAIYHIAEYVETLVKDKRLRLTKKIEKKVTYHDPCHLGRHCQAYDPPRNALKLVQGLQLLEMASSKNEALCSGAAGGFPEAFPEEADRIAGRRLEQAAQTGADLVVTACPFARERFNVVGKQLGKGPECVDVAELLSDAL